VLLLTKPLGTAIVTTAAKRGGDVAESLAAAVASMIMLNAAASGALRAFDVHACTDVTGFGLMGHGYEMAHGSGVRIVIDASALPCLPGARTLAAAGTSTGGCKRNRDWLAAKVTVADDVPSDLVEIAFDPQTSGGLLVALAEADVERAIEALHQAGTIVASRIARVEPRVTGAWLSLINT
jgi:selenide,water dikinase